MSVLYLHLCDQEGNIFDHYKWLDKPEPIVGDLIERSKYEGYINYEVTEIISKNDIVCKVKVKEHPFVKTYCDHKWEISTNIQLTSTNSHNRKCNKCGKAETYNIVTCKWS